MRRGTERVAAATLVVAGIIWLRPGTHAHRVARRALRGVPRRYRYLAGRLRGLRYRMRGRHPDPEVPDDVLADRIRSSIGGLEKRLDIPHIHVTVHRHVAFLHGAADSSDAADELEGRIAAVPGVLGVESYLDTSLGRGDTRPSEGRTHAPPSRARSLLIDAAISAGIDAGGAAEVVQAILATFADRLPPDERAQIAAHLPADVRDLFNPTGGIPDKAPPRTASDFFARVAAAAPGLDEDDAERATSTVLHVLRSLVPEEETDVTAVLPRRLRGLWQRSRSSAPSS
jgi:uncharacterized protein (DUF2267 family)